MCGIVGYVGKKDSVPIIINGLHRLEYRGYDSAGIAVLGKDGIQHVKNAGNVSELSKLIDDSVINGFMGIGHTRWATHGEPNNINAHPHFDKTGKNIGMKPAGGIGKSKLAIQYLVMVRETLGNDWLTPDLFRFGASSLANDVLMQIVKQDQGNYQSSNYFSLD